MIGHKMIGYEQAVPAGVAVILWHDGKKPRAVQVESRGREGTVVGAEILFSNGNAKVGRSQPQ